MDIVGKALKNKIKGIHVSVHHADGSHSSHDLPGDDTHSALHDEEVGKIGHKPVDGKDPHLDKDQDMDHDDESSDQAPMIEDVHDKANQERQGLHGGSIKDPEGEMHILKSLSSGGAMGRSSMSLSERGKDKMKERMASIMKNKKHA